MKSLNLWTVVLGIAVILLIGCGAEVKTEKNLLGWAGPLNVHLGTSQYNNFPKSLSELDGVLTANLKTVDGWGNPLHYRQIRGDLYHLISPGPDGELGNDDDIILKNGALYDAGPIYAKIPLKKR